MAVSWLLPEAVGMPRAREMLYTGRVIAAEEALSWGLVSEVAEDVVGRALEVALQWEALAQPVTMATADIHEGIRARREHRPPAFEGSQVSS